jgi:hypothetical protein
VEKQAKIAKSIKFDRRNSPYSLKKIEKNQTQKPIA